LLLPLNPLAKGNKKSKELEQTEAATKSALHCTG
jgi:hypothetical protein